METTRFDPEEFRRRLLKLSDADLVSIGRSVCSAASRWLDSLTRKNNKAKYRLCKKEWDCRHPRKPSPRGRGSSSATRRDPADHRMGAPGRIERPRPLSRGPGP